MEGQLFETLHVTSGFDGGSHSVMAIPSIGCIPDSASITAPN